MATALPSQRCGQISDLAAGLTDRALELLGAAGVRGDSVAMELQLWRALAAGLRRQSPRLHAAALADDVQLEGLLQNVIRLATLNVARDFAPQRDPADLDRRLRSEQRARLVGSVRELAAVS
jgi:hypothetical protein